MRFFCVNLNADGSIKGVQESATLIDFCAATLPNGEPWPHIDLGIVDCAAWCTLDGEPCTPSMAIWQRIEPHPLAGTHPDAPRVRIKPEHASDFEITWCPTHEADVIAHLETNSERGLHPLAKEIVRKNFAHRPESLNVKGLRALGYSFAEIKGMPKFVAARESMAARRITQAREAINQARIDRAIQKAKK